MRASRRLVYDFLSLPSHRQYALAWALGLEYPGTSEINDADRFARWFGECRRLNRMEQLRAAVTREMLKLEAPK